MIKITKELIERYHLDECTAEERTAVEQWLNDDFFEEEIENKECTLPENLQSDIWEEIRKTIPDHTSSTATKTIRLWPKLIAASIALVALSVLFFHNKKTVLPAYTSIRNSVSVNNNTLNVKHIDDAGYSIAISPGTYANINYRNGLIDFTGSIIICAKRDIELNIKGINKKLKFKGGQTYIALLGKSPNDHTIVISTQNLMDLPPLLQKQVVNEFRI
ncbi:hypothetical protein [Pedobacter antarcticus]|uniref:Uncharacterized protein n=2 Tax=Pedobacter antarcticus TaxID=34086 RepID=A0A081PCS2_9SPHI|nr:hypothetical protein [Pedobacter antarcticus]KEQ28495.1 hypothetical protein N180_02345 [Pedobacter antarcticus 4BY]SDL82380.1 hypothetical protein SAMN04488084_102576 [Pedobacter antarcticus]SFF02665.1 hypothetical protein SAMN03003324_02144 [Pedobacter antarcticus]